MKGYTCRPMVFTPYLCLPCAQINCNGNQLVCLRFLVGFDWFCAVVLFESSSSIEKLPQLLVCLGKTQLGSTSPWIVKVVGLQLKFIGHNFWLTFIFIMSDRLPRNQIWCRLTLVQQIGLRVSLNLMLWLLITTSSHLLLCLLARICKQCFNATKPIYV